MQSDKVLAIGKAGQFKMPACCFLIFYYSLAVRNKHLSGRCGGAGHVAQAP